MRAEFMIEFEKMIANFINSHYKPENKKEYCKCLKELKDHLAGWRDFIKQSLK